jgi:excisionase family DNA binding protein
MTGRRADLASRLAGLPPETLVPVGWLLAQLGDEGEEAPGVGRDLTVEEVAALVGRSPSTVRVWLETERLRGYRLGGRSWRVPAAAVTEFRAQQPTGKGAARGGRKLRPRTA